MRIYVSQSNGSDSFGNGTYTFPFQTLTTAFSQAQNGDEIFAFSGTYNEQFIIDFNIKRVSFTGQQSSPPVIQGNLNDIFQIIGHNIIVPYIPITFQNLLLSTSDGFSAINFISGFANLINFQNIKIIGNNLITPYLSTGIIVNVNCNLDSIIAKQCSFEFLDTAINIPKIANAISNGFASNIDISQSLFQDCSRRAIYCERLSDSSIENCQFLACGIESSYGINGGKAIDLNLKNGNYANVYIHNNNYNDCGLGVQHGGAIAVKARGSDISDSSFTSFPATIINFQIYACDLTNNERGIIAGEPGVNLHWDINNAGNNQLFIINNSFFGNNITYVGLNSPGGAVVNLLDNTFIPLQNNWWGDSSGPDDSLEIFGASYPYQALGTGDKLITPFLLIQPWLISAPTNIGILFSIQPSTIVPYFFAYDSLNSSVESNCAYSGQFFEAEAIERKYLPLFAFWNEKSFAFRYYDDPIMFDRFYNYIRINPFCIKSLSIQNGDKENDILNKMNSFTQNMQFIFIGMQGNIVTVTFLDNTNFSFQIDLPLNFQLEFIDLSLQLQDLNPIELDRLRWLILAGNLGRQFINEDQKIAVNIETYNYFKEKSIGGGNAFEEYLKKLIKFMENII